MPLRCAPGHLCQTAAAVCQRPLLRGFAACPLSRVPFNPAEPGEKGGGAAPSDAAQQMDGGKSKHGPNAKLRRNRVKSYCNPFRFVVK